MISFSKNIGHTFFIGMAILFLSGCKTVRSSFSEAEMHEIVQAANKLNMYIDYDDNHQLYIEAASWLGTPYKYGGNSRNGIDCSAFTQNIYHDVYHKKIARRSIDQMKKSCKKRIRKRKLKEGDLVFFGSAGNKRRCSHVGIYLKDKKFIHASTSKGVMVSSLHQKYWKKYWLAGGRVK